MTTYINGFDSGVSGAAVTTSSIASSGYGYQKLGATAATFTATNAIDGALAVQFVRTSGSSCYFQLPSDPLNTNDVSFSIEFTYTGSLPGVNDYLWSVRVGTAGSTTALVRCQINSSNEPFVQNNGSTVWTAGSALVLGTKYRCDARVHINASTGSINVDFYPATSSTPSFTGAALTSQNTGSSTVKNVWLGCYGSNTVSAGTTVYDLLRIDDSQSSTYWGPNTAAPPTVTMPGPFTTAARQPVFLSASATWAAGHSGTVAWTGGSSPITNATSNNATVADVGSPSLTGGNPIKDDTVTYTFTATQDDAQTASGTMTVTRVCGNRWILKGTTFVCAPLVRNR